MQLLNKKLPTIIGLVILLLGVAAGVFLVRNRQLLSPRAGPGQAEPQNIKISNIQVDSFVVSFTTATDTPAFILAGLDPELSIETSNFFLDNRDQLSGNLTPFKTHYITVANGRSYGTAKFSLETNSKYYFKIGLGDPADTKQLFDNLGQPFSTTTASAPINKPADIISGVIKDAGENNLNNVLVYLSLSGATILSDLTKDGRFVIPVNTAYNLGLDQSASYDPQATTIEILAQGEKITSTIKSITGIKNLPDITLGQDYDFTTRAAAELTKTIQDETSPTATESTEMAPVKDSTKSSFDLSGSKITGLTIPPGDTQELTITNPSAENETIFTQKPEFRGTGPSNTVISIKIESEAIITASTTVGSNGVWTYAPPQNILPGNHTITISYLLDNGDEVKTSRTFTVAGADDSTDLPSFTSTPSATISPKPTAVPTVVKPTASPTPTPAARSTMPSTESGVPTSGAIGPTMWLLLAGLIFFAFSLKIMRH